MSGRVCQICEKGSSKGNQVVRLIGNRVARRTIKHSRPNLQNIRVVKEGKVVKMRICTSCIKTKKVKMMRKGLIPESKVTSDTRSQKPPKK